MPVTCPIGRPDAGTRGHSGTPAFTMTCIGNALAAHSHSLPSWDCCQGCCQLGDPRSTGSGKHGISVQSTGEVRQQ